MATGNMLLGLARKKLGDVVFYRSEGQQRSRVRVREIKNPRSAKQSMQRMILATAAKMAAAYEPIVNHSFEGVAVGVASTRHFRSLAMQALRAAAAANVAGDANAPVADFAIKGAPIVGSLAGLPISRGTLTLQKPIFDDTYSLSLPFTPAATAIATQEAYVAELAKLGLVPGDQLTIVLQYIDTNLPVASFGNEQNFAQAVRMARVTFVPQIPEGFSGNLIADGKFNASLIENVAGVISVSAADGAIAIGIQTTGNLGDPQCGALIRSQRQPNGNFKYSSADMVANADIFDANNATEIYPSYMDGAEDIQVGDALYLRNAVAAFE